MNDHMHIGQLGTADSPIHIAKIVLVFVTLLQMKCVLHDQWHNKQITCIYISGKNILREFWKYKGFYNMTIPSGDVINKKYCNRPYRTLYRSIGIEYCKSPSINSKVTMTTFYLRI